VEQVPQTQGSGQQQVLQAQQQVLPELSQPPVRRQAQQLAQIQSWSQVSEVFGPVKYQMVRIDC